MKKFRFFIIIILAVKIDCSGQCTTPLSFSLNITPETCLGCCDGNIQVNITGGCLPYSTTVMPATSPNNYCSGNYTISVVDFGCCPVVTQTTSVGTPTGIYDTKNSNKISVGPNPNNGAFNIEFLNYIPGFEYKIFVLDMLGRKVYYTHLTSKKATMDISELENGVYFIQLTDHLNRTAQKRIIISK